MDERIEIAGILGALATHVDARRWEALAALLAPVVQVDYTSLFGGTSETMPNDQLLARWRQLLPGFTHTTHVIGTPAVTVSGDTARAVASVVASHVIKDRSLAGNDLWLVGGCYELSLRKLDGAWRITELTLARAWAEGNLDLPRIAGERAARG